MTALAFTEDKLYARPTLVSLPDPPVSPGEKVTGRFGVMAMAVAATVVIVALILAVSSSRDDASNARAALGTSQAETAVAKGETVKAQAAAAASSTQAQAALAASAATSRQLADLRAVAVRGANCIDSLFTIMYAMLDGGYRTFDAAVTKAAGICSGLGPLLRGTGGV